MRQVNFRFPTFLSCECIINAIVFPFIAGVAIDESLKQLAERRSDIFGTGVEETPIGKKHGEEERIPGMPWDPTAGLSSVTSGMEDKSDEKNQDRIGPRYCHWNAEYSSDLNSNFMFLLFLALIQMSSQLRHSHLNL